MVVVITVVEMAGIIFRPTRENRGRECIPIPSHSKGVAVVMSITALTIVALTLIPHFLLVVVVLVVALSVFLLAIPTMVAAGGTIMGLIPTSRVIFPVVGSMHPLLRNNINNNIIEVKFHHFTLLRIGIARTTMDLAQSLSATSSITVRSHHVLHFGMML